MKRRALALLALAAVLPACESSAEIVMRDAILDGVAPVSPSTNPLPTFSGRASPGAAIEIFTHPAGTGVPVAAGTASSSGTFSLVVAAPKPSRRTYYAFSTPPRAPRSGPSNGIPYACRDGGYQAASVYAVGVSPFLLAAGDFNGDAFLDLAVSQGGSSSVGLLLGDGAGGFTAGASTAVGSTPYGLAAADFNGDGFLDLAAANVGSTDVSVLLGDGTGLFAAAPGSPLDTTSSPLGLAAADLNGDAVPDLVICESGGSSLLVRLGNGDGSFASAPDVAVGNSPFAVTAADVNGGAPDLLVAASGVDVLLGNGAGIFAPAAGSPLTVPGGVIYALAVADFNGDGRLDVATADLGPDRVTVQLGAGGGAFGAAPGSPFSPGADPIFVSAADLDSDGRVDLLTSNWTADTLGFLAGNGAGGFAAVVPMAGFSEPRGHWIADFNGDGLPDLAIVNETANNVAVLLSK